MRKYNAPVFILEPLIPNSSIASGKDCECIIITYPGANEEEAINAAKSDGWTWTLPAEIACTSVYTADCM